jgi:hypothetical protein
MNRNRHAIRLPLVVTLFIAGCASQTHVAPANDLAGLLKRQSQEMMDAIAPGHVGVWRKYLHPDVIYMDENGVVENKETLLRELTPLPPGLVGRIEIDKFQVSMHGDTAVTAGEVQEYLDYHGQTLRTRFRFVDTWLRTSDGWLLAARHNAAVLKDPPAIALSSADLCSYAGVYALTPEITTIIRCKDNGLSSERTGRPVTTYLPEVRDVFFAPGQPRSRRVFLRGASGAITGFGDRREGEDVRWKRIASVPSRPQP